MLYVVVACIVGVVLYCVYSKRVVVTSTVDEHAVDENIDLVVEHAVEGIVKKELTDLYMQKYGLDVELDDPTIARIARFILSHRVYMHDVLNTIVEEEYHDHEWMHPVDDGPDHMNYIPNTIGMGKCSNTYRYWVRGDDPRNKDKWSRIHKEGKIRRVKPKHRKGTNLNIENMIMEG